MSEFWQLETLVEQILLIHTAQKMLPTDLVTFTEEILNGKIHFLGSELGLFSNRRDQTTGKWNSV